MVLVCSARRGVLVRRCAYATRAQTHDLPDDRNVLAADEQKAHVHVCKEAARAHALACIFQEHGAKLVVGRERPEEQLPVAEDQQEGFVELRGQRSDAAEEDVLRERRRGGGRHDVRMR